MEKAVFYGKHITYRSYEPNINKQFKICKKYANKKNLIIINSFSDVLDNKLEKCDAFDEMISYCKKTNCKIIIVFSRFVLSRIPNKIEKIIQELKLDNIEIKFANYPDWLEKILKGV